MVARVLIAFASKLGSNAEIADAIAAVIRDAGHNVKTVPARDIRSIDGYDAVVLGSALYAAHWQRDANRFVGRLREPLAARPLWIWSSGPLDRQLAARDLPPTANVLEIMGEVPYRAHHTFGGRLDPNAEGIDAQILKTHPVGDFRDFERVRAFGQEIVAGLAEAGAG